MLQPHADGDAELGEHPHQTQVQLPGIRDGSGLPLLELTVVLREGLAVVELIGRFGEGQQGVGGGLQDDA